MFEYDGKTYCMRELYNMMQEANQYAQNHCWCCDKEFEMGEQVVQIPVQAGLYCVDCGQSLMKALVVDAEEVKVEEETQGEESKENCSQNSGCD